MLLSEQSCQSCFSEADIEQASGSEESVDLCLDSEAEENEVSELEPSELQDAYNELHIEFCKLAKEVLGLRKKNRKLEEFIASSYIQGFQCSIHRRTAIAINS